MENAEKWILSEDEKRELINKLVLHLVMLRTKAEISQEELSSIIGVSRQTYGAIERKTRPMSWNTYLSLILFFDYNAKTHDILRTIDAFPSELIKRFNDREETFEINISELFGSSTEGILNKLDEQALSSIRTMIMIEYARCTNTPGTSIIKSFDGKSFTKPIKGIDVSAMKAFKKIKEKRVRD